MAVFAVSDDDCDAALSTMTGCLGRESWACVIALAFEVGLYGILGSFPWSAPVFTALGAGYLGAVNSVLFLEIFAALLIKIYAKFVIVDNLITLV